MKIFNLLQLKYNQFDNAVRRYLSQSLSKYNSNYGNNTIFGQLINVLGSVVQNIMLYIGSSATPCRLWAPASATREKSWLWPAATC